MATPAPSFLIESSSLQVMRTLTSYEHSSTFIFNWIFFIFAGNEDNHKVSGKFDIQPDPAELAALERLKYPHRLSMGEML